MKRSIRILLKEEMTKRYDSFLGNQKDEREIKRLTKYFSTHISKLITAVVTELNVKDIKGFKNISHEDVLKLITLKSEINSGDSKYLTSRAADSLILYIDFLNTIFIDSGIHIKYTETELYKAQSLICPNCGSTAVFQHNMTYDNYYCPTCHAKASVHKNSNIPTSTLATKEVRDLRKKVYSVVNATFNNRKDIYPFISKILPNIDFKHSAGYIGLLDGNDCEKVIRFCDYLHEMKIALQGERKIRVNHYRCAHYFLKTATLEQLRIASLVKRNYPLDKISKLLDISILELISKLYVMYSLGASLGCRVIALSEKYVKDYVILHHSILSRYYDENFDIFYQNITRANALKEMSDSSTLYHIIAYYSRVELIKKLKDISDEDFEKFKLVK